MKKRCQDSPHFPNGNVMPAQERKPRRASRHTWERVSRLLLQKPEPRVYRCCVLATRRVQRKCGSVQRFVRGGHQRHA
ncbi:unnamed protein product [Amoebophrya sp. A25]|nr:unnamed protein product [Amoebophrya sp. A25]|eukprot:GSA25T00023122001.1